MKILVLLGDFSILSKCHNFICERLNTFKIKNMCKFKQRPMIEDVSCAIICWRARNPFKRFLDGILTCDRRCLFVFTRISRRHVT